MYGNLALAGYYNYVVIANPWDPIGGIFYDERKSSQTDSPCIHVAGLRCGYACVHVCECWSYAAATWAIGPQSLAVQEDEPARLARLNRGGG